MGLHFLELSKHSVGNLEVLANVFPAQELIDGACIAKLSNIQGEAPQI